MDGITKEFSELLVTTAKSCVQFKKRKSVTKNKDKTSKKWYDVSLKDMQKPLTTYNRSIIQLKTKALYRD